MIQPDVGKIWENKNVCGIRSFFFFSALAIYSGKNGADVSPVVESPDVELIETLIMKLVL